MTVKSRLLCADDLLALPDDGNRRELVNGELRTMPPAGWEHGIVAMRLGRQLAGYVAERQLGEVFAADTGFHIHRDPDTVRAPDLAFVAATRLPPARPAAAFADIVPDLVAEVVSPSDSAADVEQKVQQWLEVGVRLVWVLYPSTRSITAYRSLDYVRVLTENDALEGADVLPGFSCLVSELFPY